MIESSYSPDIYVGNGSTTVFAYGNKITAASQLKVTLYTIADGTEEDLTLDTDYSVSGVGEDSGGNVTYPISGSPMASTHKLIIERETPVLQQTDFEEQGGFHASTHEDAFDKLTAILQEKTNAVDRSLKFSVNSELTNVELPAPEAGKYLRGNADETGYENAALTITETSYAGAISAGLDAAKAASPTANDLYIATDTKIIYVCFTTGTWTAVSITTGLDASKPASPKLGQVYLATNTTKVYVCLSAGTWTFYDPSGVNSIAGLTEKTTLAADDIFVIEDSAAANAKKKVKYSNINPGMPKNYLDGGVISNNGTDATNDLDITATECRSDDDAEDIVVAALTKRIDATWAAGTNQGFLDTLTIGGSADLVYIFAIKNTSSGVTDYLASKSATAPTMPSGYTKKRLIGARRWTGSAWAVFRTAGSARQKTVFYDGGVNVLSGGTQTTFTDVDCGDGGNECVPSTARLAVLSVRTLPASGTDGGLYLRPNGTSVAAGDALYVLDFQPLSSHRISQLIGEFPVDADGIFEYAVITNGSASIWVRGYVEDL